MIVRFLFISIIDDSLLSNTSTPSEEAGNKYLLKAVNNESTRKKAGLFILIKYKLNHSRDGQVVSISLLEVGRALDIVPPNIKYIGSFCIY